MRRGKLGEIIKKHKEPLKERIKTIKIKTKNEKLIAIQSIKENCKKQINKIKTSKLYKNAHLRFCNKCNKETHWYPLNKRSSWSCQNCGKQFFPQVGTIFQKSKTSAKKWKIAIDMCKEDEWIQATDIQKACNVTYKTAWRMRKLILKELYSEHISKGAGFFGARSFMGNQYIKINN